MECWKLKEFSIISMAWSRGEWGEVTFSVSRCSVTGALLLSPSPLSPPQRIFFCYFSLLEE